VAGFLQAVVLGLGFGGVFALMAGGITLVFATTRHVNVAHGTFMILGMYAFFLVEKYLHLNPYLGLVVVVPGMFLLGLLIFRFSFGRVVRTEPLMIFQFFIGYVLVIESLLLVFLGADFRSVPSPLGLHQLTLGSLIVRTPQLLAFGVSAAVALGFSWLLVRTDFGRSVRATAQNAEVSSLMGVNIKRTQMVTFGVAFALVALAGAMMVPLVTFNPYTGLVFTLFALFKLVMGGPTSMLGTFLAGLIIGLAYGISFFLLGSSLAATVPYALFVLIVLVRPQGLFKMR